MKFDVAIGNPPYSKGSDIDFINLGYNISTKYCLMITPAKWQTADESQNITSSMSYGKFRQKIVPHISRVVFYPNCADIFEIKQIDGITYFLIDKDTHDKAIVTNICKTQAYFNSEETRSILNGQTLHNIGNEIIESIRPYTSFKLPIIGKHRYQVWVNAMLTCDRGKEGTYQAYGFTSYKTGKAMVLSQCRIVDVYDTNINIVPDVSTLTFSSDSIEECKSFISWLYSKFTRFFIAINISKLNSVICNNTFRFVPEPPLGKFSHIYTDDELYDFYALEERYRKVIDAVIKERQQV